jgi:hypothetical protein
VDEKNERISGEEETAAGLGTIELENKGYFTLGQAPNPMAIASIESQRAVEH